MNQATLNMLTKQGDGAGGGGRAGRKVSDIVAYASAAEMATNGTLTVQVRALAVVMASVGGAGTGSGAILAMHLAQG